MSQQKKKSMFILFDSLKKPRKSIVLAVVTAGVIRIILDFILWKNGFFFLASSYDTFSRTSLACQWSIHPFFSFPPSIWVPFQFILVGSVFKAIHPFYPDCYPIVPAVINFFFFLGSLAITYYLTYRLAGIWAAWISTLLISTQAYDVWITFSGLSEPISIFFMLIITLLLFYFITTKNSKKYKFVYLMGFASLILTATHTSGWFYSIFVSAFCFYFVYKEIRFYKNNENSVSIPNLRPYIITIILSLIFPLIWICNNWILNHGQLVTLDSTSTAIFATTVGTMSIPVRLLINTGIILAISPVLMGFACYVLVNLIRKKSSDLLFLVPSSIYLIFLLAIAAAGKTAPYQEPRYMVILIWSVIPFVALTISSLARNKNNYKRFAGYSFLVILIGVGILHTFQYPNFPPVKEIGQFLHKWLKDQPENAKILIETNDYGLIEHTMIPISSGYPDRFVPMTGNEIISLVSNMDNFTRMYPNSVLVLKNYDTINAISSHFTYLKSIDGYYVAYVSNQQPRGDQKISYANSWQPTSQNERLINIPNNTTVYSFSNPDPVPGEKVGMVKYFSTTENKCYNIKLEISDGYGNQNYPDRIKQELFIDGNRYWIHDISSDPVSPGILLKIFPNSPIIKNIEPVLLNIIPVSKYEGWQKLNLQFTASNNYTEVKVITESIHPEKGWDWGRVSETAVKKLKLSPC